MLSKRLTEISKLVDKNKVVFDVGSDHALLPCFLVQNGISPKAYASDNKEGPLKKAVENINKLGLTGKVIPVLGDGLENISDDVDIITICGMGFYTIKHILEGKDLNRYDKIIVQSNKDNDLLRSFINSQNYSIINEVVIFDGFYYEAIVINPKSKTEYSDLELKYGPILLKRKDENFINYLKYKNDKLIQIYKRSCQESLLKEIDEINKILDN